MANVLAYWWIPALILLIALHRYVFQLLGVVIVPEDKIGLVIKKFVLFGEKQQLPPGRIIATEGRQVSKRKRFLQVCISVCGFGNMKLFCSL